MIDRHAVLFASVLEELHNTWGHEVRWDLPWELTWDLQWDFVWDLRVPRHHAPRRWRCGATMVLSIALRLSAVRFRLTMVAYAFI